MKKAKIAPEFKAQKSAKPEAIAPEEHEMHDPEAEGHMHTLMEGHKIKSDPSKMNRVRKMAGRHKKIIDDIMGSGEEKPNSVEDLKTMYQQKYAGDKKRK